MKLPRVAVTFKDILVNSQYQLIDGYFETKFDLKKNMIIDADEVIDILKDICKDITQSINNLYGKLKGDNEDIKNSVNDFIKDISNYIEKNDSLSKEQKKEILEIINSPTFKEDLVEKLQSIKEKIKQEGISESEFGHLLQSNLIATAEAGVSKDDDIWKYGDVLNDPNYISEEVKAVAGIAINAYNAIGDAMLWLLEAVISEEKQGELVRNVLQKNNIEISEEIPNKTLGQMLEFKKDYRNVTIKFRDGFWASAANFGIGLIDIVSVLYPSQNGGAFLFARTPLILVPGQFLRSVKGLLYGIGSVHGTRIMHVLDHAGNNLTKPFHGFFTTSDIIETIDEGWSIVQAISKSRWNTSLPDGASETIGNVTRSLSTRNGVVNETFIIEMGKTIGKNGGMLGDGSDLTKLMIVEKPGTAEVITAFPK